MSILIEGEMEHKTHQYAQVLSSSSYFSCWEMNRGLTVFLDALQFYEAFLILCCQISSEKQRALLTATVNQNKQIYTYNIYCVNVFPECGSITGS